MKTALDVVILIKGCEMRCKLFSVSIIIQQHYGPNNNKNKNKMF